MNHHFDAIYKVAHYYRICGEALVREEKDCILIFSEDAGVVSLANGTVSRRDRWFDRERFIGESHKPVYSYALNTNEDYTREEREWIRKNRISVGSRVRVCRTAHLRQRGWGNCWNEEMDDFVGRVHTVSGISDSGSGIRLSGRFGFPYFVLEPVC